MGRRIHRRQHAGDCRELGVHFDRPLRSGAHRLRNGRYGWRYDGGTNVGMGNTEQGTQLIALGYNSGVAHDGAPMFSGSISGTYVYNTALSAVQIQGR